MAKRLYYYLVDGTSWLPTFAHAAALAVLRAAADGKAHTLACMSARTRDVVDVNDVRATIIVDDRKEHSFNFTDACRSFHSDGARFKHFESACARALSRAMSTRSERTFSGDCATHLVAVKVSATANAAQVVR